MLRAAGDAFTLWIDALATAFARAGLAHPHARDLATALLASCEGAVIIARATRSTTPLDAVRRELHRAARGDA